MGEGRLQNTLKSHPFIEDDIEIYFMTKEELKCEYHSMEQKNELIDGLLKMERSLRSRRWEWERFK